MTLTELQYIVALAQERHFKRAADRVFVTQPALSLAVKKLEQELGVAIFERRSPQISLTAIGEQIVQQAQQVLEGAAQIKAMASQGENQLRGSFRLGVIATVGPYLLPSLIPILHKRAPEMPLELEENLTAPLSLMLKNGQLDAVVLALPFDEPGIATQPLYREPFRVVVPITHAWAKRKRVLEASQLKNEKVLLPAAGHCFRRQVLEACPEVSRAEREGIQGHSLETIRQMVASGLGITVLPCSALTPKHHNKRLVSLSFADPVPERTVGLAWRKGFSRPLALQALIEAVHKVKIGDLEMCQTQA
jgi:LysR family transcriptional regulator, hydrogen peroxide-inducible genes activator